MNTTALVFIFLNEEMQDRHHKIYKSANLDKFKYENPERGNYNINDPRNIVKLERIRHDGIHLLFNTLRTPKEQLKFLLDMYGEVLSDTAYELLETMISISDKEFYSPWIVK